MIVDMMMPGRNGLDVVAELRTDPAFADVPAVMLTAHDAISSRDAAADVGVDRFIPPGGEAPEIGSEQHFRGGPGWDRTSDRGIMSPIWGFWSRPGRSDVVPETLAAQR